MSSRRYRTDGTGGFDPTMEWPAHPRRLLAAQAIFDTMVPVALAKANRHQMLRGAFSGRAHIPDRVRGEIMGHATGDPTVRTLFDPDWFAEVHRLDAAGRQRAHDRQVAWNGASVIAADPSTDRGEAECHELASQNAGWVVVSQDSNAIHHGKIKRCPVFAIPDVLLIFAVNGYCLAESAWKIYEAMASADPRTESRFWPIDAGARDLFLDTAHTLTST